MLIYILAFEWWLSDHADWLGHFFCFPSMPNLGKLSFPRIFCSWPPVINNGVSSQIHPLDCVLTMIFPNRFIVSSVNPQYKSLFLFSTWWVFRFGYLNLSSGDMFCFKKLTWLAESTGIFMCTIISHLKPMFSSFLVSSPFSSYIVLTLSTKKSSSSLCLHSFQAYITSQDSWFSPHELSGNTNVHFSIFT